MSMKLAGQKYGGLSGVGVDTWGVDFALLRWGRPPLQSLPL